MKKRFLSMLLALAMVLALFPAALAADVTEEQTAGEIAYESEAYDASYSGTCGDSVSWSIANEKLTISGTGKMYDYGGGTAPWNPYEDQFTAAEVKEGVTNIGRCSFHTCYHLASVSIASSVTEIGEYSFVNCTSLKEIVFPQTVTSIGANAFNGCTALRSVTLPVSLQSIGTNAFSGCSALSEAKYAGTGTQWSAVQVEYGNALLTEALQYALSGSCGDGLTWTFSPYGVLTVSGSGKMADYKDYEDLPWCEHLEEITAVVIEEGVTSIGSCSFYYCDAMTSVTIPSSIVSIGSNAFCWCSALPSVTFPEGMTYIGNAAFSFCGALNEVIIPAGITTIGSSAFVWCTSLQAITVDADNPEYCSIDGVLFSKDTATLLCFPGGKAGAYSVPSGVKAIGSSAFEGVKNVSSVKIPMGVTAIRNYAFSQCTVLSEVTIPASVTDIAVNAFSSSRLLTSITVDAENPVYNSIEGFLCSKDGTVLICPAGKSGEITLPSGVKAIGDSAFAECVKITSITLPEGLTVVGEQAFFECSRLTAVTFPSSVTSIGKNAFAYCRALPTVILPEGITEIGVYAFLFCSSLKSITIPRSIKIIGDYAFFYCSALKDVYYGGTAEEWDAVQKKINGENLGTAEIHFTDAPDIPAAPTNLTASNKSAGVFLTWNAVSGADSYTVYRDGAQLGTCTAASYTDKTAKSGSNYTYTVQVAAGDAHSAESAAAKTVYLSVPANVKCANGTDGITVTWDKVDGATGYTLYRRLSTTTAWTAVFTSTKATTLSKLDTDVTDGKTYYYTVRANYKSADGNTKYYSSKATTGTKVVCELVKTLQAPVIKSIVNGFSSILVKWSKVSGAEGYYVYRKAENGSTWTKVKTVAQPSTGSTVSFGNTTPNNGETYTYKVAAYKGTTLSADSNEKTYMRLTYPTLTAKSTTAGKISFSWTDNAAATSFQIEYTKAEIFTGATRKTLTDYKTSTSYSGFESGKTYRVRVRAYVKYWNNAEGKYMYYYGTWSSADETGNSTQTVKVK